MDNKLDKKSWTGPNRAAQRATESRFGGGVGDLSLFSAAIGVVSSKRDGSLQPPNTATCSSIATLFAKAITGGARDSPA